MPMHASFAVGTASLEVDFGRETLTVDGYMPDRDGDTYRAHHQRYSGYTLSESLCKAVIAMGLAADWDEAIPMIEKAGVPYHTDEDVIDE